MIIHLILFQCLFQQKKNIFNSRPIVLPIKFRSQDENDVLFQSSFG